jgi:threonine dehydratase
LPHTHLINRQRILDTHKLIRPHVRRTPLVAAEGRDFGLDLDQLFFKLEFLQHSGSFKARGAFANLLMRKVPEAGVAAASGGNHGAAVAFAAQKLKHKAHVFVPAVSPAAKVERIRSYGADLVVGGERYAEALAACEDFIAQSGALPVHAFEQVETMLGQGTVGLEIEEDDQAIETLLVAVGGGGLIGGIAAWFENRVKVVAVEPEGSPTLYKALAAGEPVDAETIGIAADSLAPKRVGQIMFPIAQKYVSQSILVADADIVNAQKLLWEHLRVVVEPGGAAAFAALLSGAYRPKCNERVAVLLCGANTGAVSFQQKNRATLASYAACGGNRRP